MDPQSNDEKSILHSSGKISVSAGNDNSNHHQGFVRITIHSLSIGRRRSRRFLHLRRYNRNNDLSSLSHSSLSNRQLHDWSHSPHRDANRKSLLRHRLHDILTHIPQYSCVLRNSQRHLRSLAQCLSIHSPQAGNSLRRKILSYRLQSAH